MGPRSRRALPAPFLDKLIDEVNPHQPPPVYDTRDARRACGRWLALRRLELNLTIEQAAATAGLTPDTLLLLEAGLADPLLAPGAHRRRLGDALARADAPWLSDVIDIAFGHAAGPPAEALGHVIAELDLADSALPAAQLALLEELRAVEPPSIGVAPTEATAASPLEEPVMFEILSVLADADSHTYTVWEEISRRFGRVGVANIGVMIMLMVERQWVAESMARLEPELDSEPLQYYRITAAGREVLDAERARRAPPVDTPASQGLPHKPSSLREAG
jgi:DNA-binding PadR family transcriptional regulator